MRATVKFQLRQFYVSKEGKQSLALRYIANRKSSYFGLGISIYPKHWDKKALMVRGGDPMSYYFNKIIRDIHYKAITLIMDNYNNPLPADIFQKRLFEKKESHTDFYEFITQELEFLQTDRRKGTIDNYKKLINTMKVWKPTLSFSEITLDFIQSFHKHEIESGNKLSTVYKKHANFKFLIGVAMKKELITKNPYDNFEIKKKIKTENTDVLTEEEIAKLYDVYQSGVYSKGKQIVLRNFLFSCYCGLSFAEFDVVTYADVKTYVVDGKDCLLLVNERYKNNMPYQIPIVSDKVKSLLGTGQDFQKIFTALSNQPTNRYLKEIMKEQGIDKRITYHRARHSFRTIATGKGISDSNIERMMGHSEKDIMKETYTHLQVDYLIREMLEKWIA